MVTLCVGGGEEDIIRRMMGGHDEMNG
jgi:hypothetical protein